MGVGSEDHAAWGGIALPHVGVDDGLMGRDKLAAVLLAGRESEEMVVLVDGTAHGAQGIVAVGQYVGQWELLEPGGPGRLYNAYVGDIVRSNGVEFNLQAGHIAAGVVGGHNPVGHGALPRLLRGGQPGRGAVLGGNKSAVPEVNAAAG